MADRRCLAAAAVGLLLAASLASAGDYIDYADVVSAVPVVETAANPAGQDGCAAEADTSLTASGPVRGTGIAALVDAVVGDLDRAVCRQSPPNAQRVVGYRVTYRYDGSEYVSVLNDDPGTRLRVRVRLEARP